MEELKGNIQHVIWEFKNNKNATETAKVSLLTAKSENGSQSFILVIHHWEMNPDQDAHQTSIKNWWNVIHAKYLRNSTWPQYISINNLKKWKFGFSHTLHEKNKEDRITIATSLLSKQRNDTFLKNIVMWYATERGKGKLILLPFCVWINRH